MTRNWIAAHIFYSGDLNLLLTACVSPFMEQHIHLCNGEAPWFFIRYPEGGDHIRLRINTIHQDQIKQALLQEVNLFFQNNLVVPEISNKRAFPDMSVQYLPYDPEITRYGDEQSLPWAEQHFAVSSHVIMEWYCCCMIKPASARIHAIQLHLLLLLSTGRPAADILSLCEYFINDWLKIFHSDLKEEKWLDAFKQAFDPQKEVLFDATLSFWNAVLDGKIMPYYFSRNKEIMSKYYSAGFSLQQLTVIITSMMHMTHNRLGIENPEEAYIMYCTHACLSYILSQNETT